jgi:hypothetical protein
MAAVGGAIQSVSIAIQNPRTRVCVERFDTKCGAIDIPGLKRVLYGKLSWVTSESWKYDALSCIPVVGDGSVILSNERLGYYQLTA